MPIVPAFPRHHRRGSIEAIVISLIANAPPTFRDIIVAAPLKRGGFAEIRECSRAFRDIIVAAPLKRYSSFSPLLIKSNFPRHHRRGSIEAWLVYVASCPLLVAFRDIIVAAPLKRSSLRLVVERRLLSFRDIIVAAPLKLRRPTSFDSLRSSFRDIIVAAPLKHQSCDLRSDWQTLSATSSSRLH